MFFCVCRDGETARSEVAKRLPHHGPAAKAVSYQPIDGSIARAFSLACFSHFFKLRTGHQRKCRMTSILPSVLRFIDPLILAIQTRLLSRLLEKKKILLRFVLEPTDWFCSDYICNEK